MSIHAEIERRHWKIIASDSRVIMAEISFLVPLVAALFGGALIGLERELNGSAAGIRTHILVSVASALLMVAAVHQFQWMNATPVEAIRIDPVRMAHGILTGIGFLGAGVIFRTGSTVRGLTTAASLWLTAVIGILLGIEFYSLAISAVFVTLLVLVGLRVVMRSFTRPFRVEVFAEFSRAAVGTSNKMMATLNDAGLVTERLSEELSASIISVRAVFLCKGVSDYRDLGSAIARIPDVLSYRIAAHDSEF